LKIWQQIKKKTVKGKVEWYDNGLFSTSSFFAQATINLKNAVALFFK